LLAIVLAPLASLNLPNSNAASSEAATISNTGFEDGLTAWLGAGGVTAVGPTETIETNGNTWVYGVYQTKAARLEPNRSSTFASIVETNLGLSTSEVSGMRDAFSGGPTDAAWISSEVTLQSGTTYRMAWNYASTDYEPYNDGSITTLVPITVPGTPVITINNSPTNDRWALLGFTNIGTGMYSTGSYGSTGWQFSTYQVSESGTYKLGFATFNIDDNTLPPILLVDDGLGTVTKNGEAFNPVAPNDPTAPSLAQSISPTTQALTGAIGSAVTPSTAFTASGMVGTISYAISAGTLPTGLTLDTSTGVISGTPTAISSGSLTITATGSTSGTASATLTLEFKNPQSPLTLNSTTGTPGVALPLVTSGGSGTGLISYTVSDGTATGCAVSGGELTSTTPGTCLVTATKAGDADYNSISSSLTTVTFGATESAGSPAPSSPTPTPIESPIPTPVESPTPKPILGPPSNGVKASPTPTPAPDFKLGSINLIPPQTPNPGVVYSSTNPIPKLLLELLDKPLAYVLQQLNGDPLLPELAPADSIAYENGSPVQIQLVKTDDENGYVLIGDGWQVVLEAADSSGTPLRIDESGNIILNKDRFVQFSGAGFAPGSIVKVWLFSDPAEISEVQADASGNFIGEAQLPEGVPVGQHTVQLNGLTGDGQLRSVSLGVVVEPVAVVPTPVPFDFSGLMNMLWILAAGVLFFFFILWRRRKKEEEEGATLVSDSSEDLIFASDAFEVQPTQQFPNDSRRKIGAAAPPNRKRLGFKPKGT